MNKMIHEEWLLSSVQLCDLVTASESVHSDVVIVRSSFPQPSYNQSSIQNTLEAYSLLFDSASEQYMKQTDLKMMEHQYPQIESIHHFAQMTAETIIDSAVTKGETLLTENADNICTLTDQREAVRRRNDVKMLAGELTLQAFCEALDEMGQHCVLRSDEPSVLHISSKSKDEEEAMEGIHENASVCSSGYKCDEDTSEMEMDSKMEEYNDKSVSLKSMVNVGSIDYPDAPPSTPLLPEMLKSQASFSRKLKGGLAKEFLPSPPPPTPKDHMQPLLENQITDTSSGQSEFMMRLMRSLSLEICRQGGLEEEKAGEVDGGGLQNEISRLSNYAAQLSADILNFITTNDTEVNKHVWATAEQLVDEIVITSLAEVMARKKDECRDQNGQKSIVVDVVPLLDVASPQRPNTARSTAEEIKGLAGELIINAVSHAFAKLKQDAFKDGTHPHVLGQETEQQPWQNTHSYSNTHLSKDSTQAKTVSRCNNTLDFNCITSDAMEMTSSVHAYANNFAEYILENSVRDASSLLVNFRPSQETQIGSRRDVVLCTIEMNAEVSRDVEELKCVLLWAVASQKGTLELHFDLPDTSLKEQLCRLSGSAHLGGWTVGSLMALLCEFCGLQEESSRGQYKSSDSLLQHLRASFTAHTDPGPASAVV